MVLVAMLCDLILLPQLLASPLGRFFTAGLKPATIDERCEQTHRNAA
jgi:hypothetical protein